MDAIEYAMLLSSNLYASLYMFANIVHAALLALIVAYLVQKMLEAATVPLPHGWEWQGSELRQV